MNIQLLYLTVGIPESNVIFILREKHLLSDYHHYLTHLSILKTIFQFPLNKVGIETNFFIFFISLFLNYLTGFW